MRKPNPPAHPLAWNGFLNRRDLLRVGSLGVASSLLPPALQPAAWARSQAGRPAARARSVILLWMAGGVTHIDSFDPKPEAPESVRGTLKAIDTAVPGVRFCETLPG